MSSRSFSCSYKIIGYCTILINEFKIQWNPLIRKKIKWVRKFYNWVIFFRAFIHCTPCFLHQNHVIMETSTNIHFRNTPPTAEISSGKQYLLQSLEKKNKVYFAMKRWKIDQKQSPQFPNYRNTNKNIDTNGYSKMFISKYWYSSLGNTAGI